MLAFCADWMMLSVDWILLMKYYCVLLACIGIGVNYKLHIVGAAIILPTVLPINLRARPVVTE